MSSYSGKRLCDMMDDGLDDLLSQAVDRCEKEEFDLDDGLDGILSQSLDIFEQKSRGTTQLVSVNICSADIFVSKVSPGIKVK